MSKSAEFLTFMGEAHKAKGYAVSGSASVSSSNSLYIVRSGDTRSQIASRIGIGLNDLLRANPQIKEPKLDLFW